MRRLSFALAATLLCACGTRVAYVPLNKAPRAMKARAPSEVEVFTSSQPTRSFTEVGMIEAQQESLYSGDSPQQVFGKLRTEAAQRGCDAIIVSGNDGVHGVNHGNGFYGTNVKTLKGYRGTCVVYNDDVQAPAEAPKTTDAQPL